MAAVITRRCRKHFHFSALIGHGELFVNALRGVNQPAVRVRPRQSSRLALSRMSHDVASLEDVPASVSKPFPNVRVTLKNLDVVPADVMNELMRADNATTSKTLNYAAGILAVSSCNPSTWRWTS